VQISCSAELVKEKTIAKAARLQTVTIRAVNVKSFLMALGFVLLDESSVWYVTVFVKNV
jgi:hypothetical protein